MLSEYDKELLTAFVDGEMTRRQRTTVLALLHQSSEARAFLRELQENAHLFKQVPERKLDESFADQVLGEIAARGLKPTAPVLKPARGYRRPLWIAAAVAAAVLVAVGIWFSQQPGDNSPIAKNKDDDLLVLPASKTSYAMADLSLPAKKEELAKEFARDASVHLDLSVKHGTRAVQQVMVALKEQKVDVIFAPRDTLRKNEANTRYVVYAEGVRAEELVSLLQSLGADAKGKTVQAGFETLSVGALDARARQQFSKIVQGHSQEPTKKEPAKGKLEPLSPERFAVVLTTSADGEAFSPEVRAFLDGRREARPGTMQVLLVVTPLAA